MAEDGTHQSLRVWFKCVVVWFVCVGVVVCLLQHQDELRTLTASPSDHVLTPRSHIRIQPSQV